jgi:hypothetical protein
VSARVPRLFALCVGLLLLAGCGTYRSARLGAIAPWPPAARRVAQRVELRLYGNLRDEGGALELGADELVLWREQARRAYAESGLFGEVSDRWSSGDLIAEIGFVIRTTSPRSPERILSALPYQRHDLIARTRFLDRDGHELGTVELSEGVRFYSLRALLPFLAPSASGNVVRQVVYDLHRATLRRALDQGLLAAHR